MTPLCNSSHGRCSASATLLLKLTQGEHGDIANPAVAAIRMREPGAVRYRRIQGARSGRSSTASAPTLQATRFRDCRHGRPQSAVHVFVEIPNRSFEVHWCQGAGLMMTRVK